MHIIIIIIIIATFFLLSLLLLLNVLLESLVIILTEGLFHALGNCTTIIMSFTAPRPQLQAIRIIISTRTLKTEKKHGGPHNFAEAPSPHENENYNVNVQYAELC